MIHRIYKPRKAGIPANSNAPFWRGERAEDIVSLRVKEERLRKKRLAKKRKIAALKRKRRNRK